VEELASAFNTLSRTLARDEAFRKNLIADISHELRTPLASQRVYLEALEDGVMEFDPESLQVFVRNNLLLSRLVEDLRQPALADAGRLELSMADVDVEEALREAAGFEGHLREKDISLSIHVPTHIPKVRADPGRLSQILVNLPHNAITYTPEGGSITMGAGQEGDEDMIRRCAAKSRPWPSSPCAATYSGSSIWPTIRPPGHRERRTPVSPRDVHGDPSALPGRFYKLFPISPQMLNTSAPSCRRIPASFRMDGTEVAMKTVKTWRTILAGAALAALLFSAASCGSEEGKEPTTSATKLPPGMAESEAYGSYEEVSPSGTATAESARNASTGSSESSPGETGGSTTGVSTARTATLSGVEFTVVAAKREDSNKLVASSGTRQVNGDFLEVELKIKNAGDSLVNLSRFSFRLWNPYIRASSYDDYYGDVTTYGGYVSKNIISAALLDYSTLHQVTATLRIGEEMDDVFLFFDLNPLSVSKNEGFTKEGSNLVIYDTQTGGKTEINLAGFPD